MRLRISAVQRSWEDFLGCRPRSQLKVDVVAARISSDEHASYTLSYLPGALSSVLDNAHTRHDLELAAVNLSTLTCDFILAVHNEAYRYFWVCVVRYPKRIGDFNAALTFVFCKHTSDIFQLCYETAAIDNTR